MKSTILIQGKLKSFLGLCKMIIVPKMYKLQEVFFKELYKLIKMGKIQRRRKEVLKKWLIIL